MKILNVSRRSPTIHRGATPTELMATTRIAKTRHHNALFPALFVFPGLLTSGYMALSLYAATRLAHAPQKPLLSTPDELGLLYQDVTFPSREDHLQLRGWLIPGILPSGALTLQRTIILVHGNSSNRADPLEGLLNLSRDLAHRGFAVLAFDLRGHGTSSPAPRSLGYFEQRDVLGAVDFLRTGSLPYPELGRPRHIGGWGISMGAATLLLAAAREASIEAVVSDCAYAEILPILEREIPKVGHLPAIFTPAILLAARAIYGIDFSAVRPVDVVAHIAPRPICFIHGDTDQYVPASHVDILAKAASAGPSACVQTWLVPGADHAQSYRVQGNLYVSRLVAFYTAALGPDPGDM